MRRTLRPLRFVIVLASAEMVGLLAGSHVLPDHRSRLEAAGAAQVFDSFEAVAAWLGDNAAGPDQDDRPCLPWQRITGLDDHVPCL